MKVGLDDMFYWIAASIFFWDIMLTKGFNNLSLGQGIGIFVMLMAFIFTLVKRFDNHEN